jgi:hypothetical protein
MPIVLIILRIAMLILYVSICACANKKSKLKIDPHSIHRVKFNTNDCKEVDDHLECNKVKMYPSSVQVQK